MTKTKTMCYLDLDLDLVKIVSWYELVITNFRGQAVKASARGQGAQGFDTRPGQT